MSRLIDADLLLNDKNKKMVGEYVYSLMHCLVSDMPTVKAIPIEKLEQIRAEIDKLPKYIAKFTDCTETHICKDSVLEIIDKALKEQNE